MAVNLHERAEKLARKYGYWEEHPDYPSDDWQESVINRGTRLSYWEWVADKIETEQDSVRNG
jgi:hypothetical protein